MGGLRWRIKTTAVAKLEHHDHKKLDVDYIWQVPSILEDSTKDESSGSEEEEDEDDEEKSGEETEAQLDRKVEKMSALMNCVRWLWD